MRDLQRAFCLLFLSVYLGYALTACASFMPTEKPATLEERIGVASLTLSGVRSAHANLIESGRVTPKIDADLIALEKSADDSITLARAALKTGDLTTAEGQLKAMQMALLALNKRIAQLEGK